MISCYIILHKLTSCNMGVRQYDARYASVITASGCASGMNRVCIGVRIK